LANPLVDDHDTNLEKITPKKTLTRLLPTHWAIEIPKIMAK
jgi:hypothetical protein